MKYWNTLTEIEQQVIRVGEFKNLMNLIANGAECSTPEQLESGFFTLLGMIEDIDEKLSENFQTLWDEIRNDDSEEESEIHISEDNMNVNWDFGAGTFTVTDAGAGDTITITGLDPDYGDHGGGSTLDDYPELKQTLESDKRWTHIVNELTKFKK